TVVDEVWKACITPNDGYGDGTEVCSNELTIIGSELSNIQVDPLDAWVVNDTIKFECEVNSEIELVNGSLWHNYTGTWNMSSNISLSGNSTAYEFNESGFDIEKTFVWACEACNGMFCDMRGNRTLTIDITKPGIEFVDPTFENNEWNTTYFDDMYVNVSTTDTNNHSVIVDWNRSLIGWWRMEQGNGTYFEDSSTYGHPGTCAGEHCPEVWTGARGKAYNFDGVDDAVNISYVYGGGDVTVAAWFKIGNLNHIDNPIIDKSYGFFMLTVHDYEDGPKNLVLRIHNGTHSLYSRAYSSIYEDVWYYGLGTVDSVNKYFSIYLNGVLYQNLSYVGPLVTGSSLVTLGSFAGGVEGLYTNATIDEVMFWNRVLTPQEINASYQAGLYNYEKNFTDLGPGVYNYTAYAYDMAGNLNQTEYRNFTVNRLPNVSDVVLSSDSGYDFDTDNLTVTYDSADGDNDTVKNITNWYVNGTSIMVLNMPFEASTSYNESSWTKDYSNNSNHGNVSGAEWLPNGGNDGFGAYDFVNADNDYIDSTVFDVGDDFTVVMWLDADQTNDGRAFVGKHDAGGNNQFVFGYFNGGYEVNIRSSIDQVGTKVTGWQHLAVVGRAIGASDTNVTVYRNGTSIGSFNLTMRMADLAVGKPWTIGQDWDSASSRTDFFDGRIADVRIYNRSLSAEQVQLLYQGSTDMIHYNETLTNESWMACITPNDGKEDGIEVCSNALDIIDYNDAPIAFDVVLNSTYGTNFTTENLTVYWNVSDFEGETVRNITNWYVNGTSIMVLNMPFEAG
ncbi:LamG domain-containing protein, partial [Nanoarchaeota archaeon]